jgi:hypothetical protein
MVHSNLAWAYALLGDVRQSVGETSRARDEYGRVDDDDDDEVPPWLEFFDSAELQAIRGASLAYLPQPSPAQRAEAIDRFALSSALRELPMTRSRTFELIMLSWMLVDNGDLGQALSIGHQAMDQAERLRSQRVIDRLAPLRASLRRAGLTGGAAELDARIDALVRCQSQAPPGAGAGPTEDAQRSMSPSVAN